MDLHSPSHLGAGLWGQGFETLTELSLQDPLRGPGTRQASLPPATSQGTSARGLCSGPQVGPQEALRPAGPVRGCAARSEEGEPWVLPLTVVDRQLPQSQFLQL